MMLAKILRKVTTIICTNKEFNNALWKRMSAKSLTTKTPIPVFGIEGRYVSALYSAAIQLKQIDEVETHLRNLEKELVKPKIVDFLESSMMSSNAKAALLLDVGKQAGMPKSATNFLALVAENGRLKKLRKMINIFLTVMVAHRNEALCEVITAQPLDSEDRKSLMDALNKFVKEGKKIQLTEKIDPSIIGGMIIGIEDKHIDMSIARKIQMYTDILKQAV